MAVNGKAAGVISIGALFVYSGLRGFSILKAIQNTIQGKSPLTGQSVSLISSGQFSNVVNTFGQGNLPASGTYTQAQLIQLWQQAGGSPQSAQNAACHAMQESSGNPMATSSNPDGGTNVGLWQLDTKGVGAGHTVQELQIPIVNARITVGATGDGADWSKWATPGC